MKKKNNKIDCQIINEGSVFMIMPLSGVTKIWIDENLQTESWQWLGNNLVIEHRYIKDIVQGMINDGLVVQ